MDAEARKYFEDLKYSFVKFKKLRARCSFPTGNYSKEELHKDYLKIQDREFIIDELFRIIK